MKITMQRMHNPRILVVGDVMLDRYWFGAANRISPEAPVPVVEVMKCEERLGGAANVVRNIRALGVEAGLIGVVGADEAAERVTRLLDECGAHHKLQTVASTRTTVKLRVVASNQQLVRLDFEPSEEASLDLSTFTDVHSRYDAIIFSDYLKGSLAEVHRMIERAVSCDQLVLVDPKGDSFTKYRGASVITPNRGELRQVIGPWRTEEELHEKAERLRCELEVGAIILTRSEEGMTLFADGAASTYPTQAQEVFDVSGAGDTVIATLATALLFGKSLSVAVQLANLAAGAVIGKFGTATVNFREIFPDQDKPVSNISEQLDH